MTIGTKIKLEPERAAYGIARRRPRAPLRRLQPLIVPAVAAAIWEIVARLNLLSSALFPRLSQVADVLIDWILGTDKSAGVYSGTWIDHVSASTARVLLGFAVGAAGAVILGFLVGRWATWRTLFDPLIQGLRPVPITAWIPLAVIWFGIGARPAIFLVLLGAFFPVYVNTVAGVANVDTRLIRAGRMLGANKRAVLSTIVLPAALPTILTGMRVGLGFAWMCVIVSEMLAVKSGIGYVLWDSYYYANIAMVVAAMITIGALGYLSDVIMRFLARRFVAWSDQEVAA